MSERTFVRWDSELQEAFNELTRREGASAAARGLHMPERNLHDLRAGLSRAGYKDGRARPRKFLSLQVLERLAGALDDPGIENREALSQQEWSDRGEWSYFSTSGAA